MTHKEFVEKVLVFKKKPWRKHRKHHKNVEERAHHHHRRHHKNVEERAHHHHRRHHKKMIAEIEKKI